MLHSIWKLTSFANGLKSEPAYKRPRQYETERTPDYGNIKSGRLHGNEQGWRADRA